MSQESCEYLILPKHHLSNEKKGPFLLRGFLGEFNATSYVGSISEKTTPRILIKQPGFYEMYPAGFFRGSQKGPF